VAPACAAADAAAGGAQHPAAVADIAGEMTHAGADAAAVGDPTPAEAAAAGPASASGAADSAAEAAACGGGRWQWVDVALAAAPPDSEAGSHGHGDSWDADASAGSNRMSITMQNVYHHAEGTPLSALTEHSTCDVRHHKSARAHKYKWPHTCASGMYIGCC